MSRRPFASCPQMRASRLEVETRSAYHWSNKKSKLWGGGDSKGREYIGAPDLESFPSMYDGRRHTEQHSLVISCLPVG